MLCRDINITDDLFVESNENFTVTLATVHSNDTVNNGVNRTVTIQDNDGT